MPRWSDTPEARAFQRRFTAIVSVAALLAWIIAIYGVAKAPWVPDLYHLVNGDSPHPPENTLLYLFVGPIMLTLGSLTGWLGPDYALSQMPKAKNAALLSAMGAGCVVIALVALTVFRAQSVLLVP
jgi:hypothetical protein